MNYFDNDSSQVPVGGFGFICVDVSLPVCKTQIDISVKHPMLDDRELAEVFDGAQVRRRQEKGNLYSVDPRLQFVDKFLFSS